MYTNQLEDMLAEKTGTLMPTIAYLTCVVENTCFFAPNFTCFFPNLVH